MSEYVYTDIKSTVTEIRWNAWDSQWKLAYLESLIGYKIYNGSNWTYSWDGCPVSEFAGASDSSGDPYIVVQPTFQYIKFKPSGSSQVFKKVYPEQVDGETIVRLSGTLHWGEISFATDTQNLYQWNNGEQQKDELNTGFGFILDDDIETKKVYSASDDIYLINTENFKIKDKKICVYGKAGANQVNSGNYTYSDDFNYGYARGKNYYAWGKNQVQVIPLWTNELGYEVDESDGKGIIFNNNRITIHLKDKSPISYNVPLNSKMIVCKRTGAANVAWDGMYLDHSVESVDESHYTCTLEHETLRNIAKTSLALLTEDTQVPSSTWSFYRSIYDNRYFLSTDGKTYTGYQSPGVWNPKLGFEATDFEQNNYVPECDKKEKFQELTKTYASAVINIKKNTTKHSFKTIGLYRSSLFKLADLQFIVEDPDPRIVVEKWFSYIDIHSVTKVTVSGISDTSLTEKSWLDGKNEKGVLTRNGKEYPYYDNYDQYAAVYASTQIEVTRPYPCYWVFIVPKDFEAVPQSA